MRLALSRTRAVALILCPLWITVPLASPEYAFAASDANSERCSEFAGTEASPGFRAYLPDCRAYEMVSPTEKAGSVISPQSATVAADGSSLVGASSGAFAGLTNDELPSQGVASYRFSRTAAGWVTTPLQISQGDRQSVGVSDSVWRPASELGVAQLSVRQPDGAVNDVGPVWPSVFGTVSPNSYHVEGAAGEAERGIVFISEEPTPRWPFDTNVSGGSLYKYVGTDNTEPSLVGVSGGAGSTTLIGQCGTRLGAGRHVHAGSKYNAVSESGATVFFTAEAEKRSLSSTPTSAWASSSTCENGSLTGTAPPTDELYARVGGSQTVWVSEPQCTPASACKNVATEPYASEETSEAAGATFEGASKDGTKVFFTTTQQLTNGDTDTTRDLYEYNFDAPAGQRLIQVSAGGSGDLTPGAGAMVDGAARISEDGSHVYFVAKGVLTTAPNSEGHSALQGADNLYVFEPDPGHPGQNQTAFVAELCSDAETSGAVPDARCPSNLNSEPWNFGTNHNDQGLWSHGENGGDERPIQATPDGRFLVFTSYGDLTADDTSSARQVFQYDAQDGQLQRISIGENGFNADGNAATGNASIVTPIYDQPEAGWTRGGAVARTMSDDGSYVFFESPAALTRHALNDVAIDPEQDLAENVYEYRDGGVFLISDGSDTSLLPRVSGSVQKSGVVLVGTSASGDDVFFTTVDPLVPQDTDTEVDIYDARIGGGLPAPSSALACNETCQGAPSAPMAFGAPSSATFSGPGNLAQLVPKPRGTPPTRAQKLTKALKACRAKHNKHRRAVCERQARARYRRLRQAKTSQRGR